MSDFDVCIVGSGAGAGPVIYELSKAGYKVVVLEKGPWFKTENFAKDEMSATRRSVYTPNLKDEKHVLVTQKDDGKWYQQSTEKSGRDFWNGNVVGGSSNFMSAYFHRLKPVDFKLLSTYGPIEGANLMDWPIEYEELEPYYTKAEEVVGVSGKVVEHPFLEPRSTPDFPFAPLQTNKLASIIDDACEKLNYSVFPSPRGIISRPTEDRNACYYSNFCGSYGCSSNAKSSSRVSLINPALKTGNCTVIPNSKVYHLETDGNGKLIKAHYYDENNAKQEIEAKIFVVAAQAVETSRLLLMSKNKDFPNGLANNSDQVGKNLLFSAGGVGSGQFFKEDFPENFEELMQPGLFVNRATQHWYEINDENLGKIKGGTIDFVVEHANPVTKAVKLKTSGSGLVFGKELQAKMESYFKDQRKFKFEIFADWLPTDHCKVRLDGEVTDKWGDPVARIYIKHHDHDFVVSEYLAEKGKEIFEQMGAKNIATGISHSAPSNLQAGGCRFGNDPKTSVLDKNCKAHEVENLYVSDGSFMPTGGSVTFTFTIYANAFRVADKIKEHLSSLS